MMTISVRTLSAALVAVLSFTACGGGHSGTASLPAAPQQPSNTNLNGAQTAGFTWGQQFVSKLTYTGPARAATGMSIVVGVRMQNAAGLVAYAQSASDPRSANYRRWLTPAQIGQSYGATVADYQSAASYLKSFGLQVGGWPQREVLTVSGSTAQFGKAFGTTFGTYTFRGKAIVAANGTPHIPTTVPITWAPLVSATPKRTFILHGNNAEYYGYAPQQIATGFDYSGAWSAGYTGTGINVGIIGTGPILASNGKSDDLAALATYWHATVAPLSQINATPQNPTAANGGTGTGSVDYNPTNLSAPPPVTTPNCTLSSPPLYIPNYTACNPEDGEAQLDTQSQASLAKGATVLFYNAYNSNEFCVINSNGNIDPTPPVGQTCPANETPYPEEGIDLADDSIQQAIADNRADAISMSFGGPENLNEYYGYIGTTANPGVGQIEMASLAAEGIAVFVSSGDDGAWECFDPVSGDPLGTACASYPASDPNVVAVGGVNIPLDESGNLTGSITAWADNTTLGGDGSFGNNVGSGGGVSAYLNAPAWQVATLGNSMRYIPDMSLDADPNTGPSIFIDVDYGYGPSAIGGTSASAPEAAAMWALVLQACKASSSCNQGGTFGYRLGNPSGLLYSIYSLSSFCGTPYAPNGFTPHLNYAQVFYDVTYGDNQAAPSTAAPQPATTPSGYNSGPGYDQVTGIGAPFAGHLIQAVTGTTVP